MDSFEFNKMAGAVLGTALVVFGLSELSGIVYEHEKPEKQGYAIEVAEAATGGEATGGETKEVVPIAKRLATADVAKGQAQAKACGACHDFTKGGPNKVGPNLWDVVEREKASHAGFAYSDAMKAHAGEKWDYAELDKFIISPKADVPNTKMTFAGIKDDAKRADVIAYLRTLSDSPKPLPAP